MRVRTPVVLATVGVAWLTTRERDPRRWPAFLKQQAHDLARDAREAAVDGARAGARAERAFDDELAAARGAARTWQ
jgi:hypothetical protein